MKIKFAKLLVYILDKMKISVILNAEIINDRNKLRPKDDNIGLAKNTDLNGVRFFEWYSEYKCSSHNSKMIFETHTASFLVFTIGARWPLWHGGTREEVKEEAKERIRNIIHRQLIDEIKFEEVGEHMEGEMQIVKRTK